MEGVVKDKAKLAVAAVKGGETQDLYVAVTKATLAEEVVPKEKHVRTLKIACSAHAPRQQVDFVIYKLGKRLNSPNWVVALKALMTFHRLMRECDPTFMEQLVRFSERTGRHRMLCLDRYADHTSRETWDYSAWIRSYSAFLDERLEAFRIMRFDPESGTAARQQHAATSGFGGYGGPTGAGYGGPTGAGYGGPTGAGYGGPTGAGYGGPTGAASGGAYGGLTGGYTNGATGGTPRGTANGTVTASSLKDCGADDLLERLPRVQRLMLRMLACVPEGAATTNALCLHAASWVLRESKAVYRAASEGVINLADKFFEMERTNALRGLDLYKDALVLHDKLTAYYAAMQAVPALRGAIHYPLLQPLPADFVATMEDYAKEAPRDGAGAHRAPQPPPAAPATTTMVAEEPQPAAAAKAAQEPEATPASPPKAPQAEPVRAALGNVIDLLSFDDEPAPVPDVPEASAQPGSKGELDFLADGMGQGQQQQQSGFEPGAFDGGAAGFSGQQQQQQQPGFGQPGYFGPPGGAPAPYGYAQQPTGYGYPGPYGYAPQPGAFPGYAPQPTGYAPQPTGYAPQPTGYGSTALVAVGPMGNPFMQPGFGGMPPAATYGAAPPPPSNPFNPFNEGGAAAATAGGTFVGQRMENDPLNELTAELLGALPKPKGTEPQAPSPSLRELRTSGQRAPASPQPTA